MTRNHRYYRRAYGNVAVAVGAIIASQLVKQPFIHGVLLVIVGLYAGAGCGWVITWPILHPDLSYRRMLRIAMGWEDPHRPTVTLSRPTALQLLGYVRKTAQPGDQDPLGEDWAYLHELEAVTNWKVMT